MNNYKEIYEEWFDSEDNVIVISENDYTKLILGFSENLIISVGYIINIGGKCDISIDSQFTINWKAFSDDDLTKYVKNTQQTVYQIMFNIVCCMNNRGIQYSLNMNQANKDILGFDTMCSISEFKDKLKSFIHSKFYQKVLL
jgi:hypothetical protein